MTTTLIFAEIIFYFTVSLAIIAVGILCATVVYYLVRLARELEEISHNMKLASNEAGERINYILDKLSILPVLSFFLKKHPATRRKKEK
jgi:hypothetical protein